MVCVGPMDALTHVTLRKFPGPSIVLMILQLVWFDLLTKDECAFGDVSYDW